MRRESSRSWTAWEQELEKIGFVFHSQTEVYWNSTHCYKFSAKQIDFVESVTNELHELCLEAIEVILRRDWFARLGIMPHAVPLILDDWASKRPSLYGRFDLAWDGGSSIKMLEYNADTPTSLLEASVAQWKWLEQLYPEHDQFNSIHEKLIARWPLVADVRKPLHFTCLHESMEDLCQTEYLRDTAIQAQFKTQPIALSEVGWDSARMGFVDQGGRFIAQAFKLYPWEWLVRERFGVHLRGKINLIEPAWKMLLSNKGLLAILWELYPNHPYLLPTFFAAPTHGEYVRKPLFSREGANIARVRDGHLFGETPGDYGAEGYVYQAYHELPRFDDKYPVIGSWVIGDTACGIGIREDVSPITQNLSQFVPHYSVRQG